MDATAGAISKQVTAVAQHPKIVSAGAEWCPTRLDYCRHFPLSVTNCATGCRLVLKVAGAKAS